MTDKKSDPKTAAEANEAAKTLQENLEKAVEETVDKAVETAQKGILKGARKVQKTYGSLKRGDYGVKVNTDSSILAFGAGLGAGLGLGASLLFKMTPAGRIATVLFSAAAGALASSLETPSQNKSKNAKNKGRAQQPETDAKPADLDKPY